MSVGEEGKASTEGRILECFLWGRPTSGAL